MNVHEKLVEVQANLICPKSQYNSFAKYNYRSCEDILEGLKPFLSKLKVTVTLFDEIVLVGDRYYIKATARFTDAESGECLETVAYARESEEKKGNDASQVTGSTSSYARKYALNGLFAIDDVKDADTRDNRQAEAKEQKNAEDEQKKIENMKVSDIKVKALLAKCESEGVDPKKICKLYKIKDFSELTEKKYRNVADHWQEIKDI